MQRGENGEGGMSYWLMLVCGRVFLLRKREKALAAFAVVRWSDLLPVASPWLSDQSHGH
jgi:uncharacterized membrane protein